MNQVQIYQLDSASRHKSIENLLRANLTFMYCLQFYFHHPICCILLNHTFIVLPFPMVLLSRPQPFYTLTYPPDLSCSLLIPSPIPYQFYILTHFSDQLLTIYSKSSTKQLIFIYRVMSLTQKIQDLSNLSTALGLIMKSPATQSFVPIKLTLQPYMVKKSQYHMIGEISKVWQKLLYLASKDAQLIKKTFQKVSQVDQMVSNLYRIFTKTSNKNDSLLISRIDYFKNTNDEFKIIQYNVTATSMHTHIQNYQNAQKMIQFKDQRNPDLQYPNNTPCSDMADSISTLYKMKNLTGLFLMVVAKSQRNIIDQTSIQIKLMERGIKTKRQGLCSLHDKIQKRDNKLFYLNQEVSVVYYRAGYCLRDYCQGKEIEKCWEARETIQLSDAIKIPDVKMQLMNQKRMQVELSKPQVHESYLNEQECKLLRRSLVFTVDFEQSQQTADIIKLIQQKGTDRFILKPNLEGGGNNIYGQKAYEMLKQLNEQERKKYILMEKIETNSLERTTFVGKEFRKQKCICEVSRYALLLEVDGKLVQNDSEGYLVRVKPETSDQGGVMAGVGSIATIAYDQ